MTLYVTCHITWCSQYKITKECTGDGTIPIVCGTCGNVFTDVKTTPPLGWQPTS